MATELYDFKSSKAYQKLFPTVKELQNLLSKMENYRKQLQEEYKNHHKSIEKGDNTLHTYYNHLTSLEELIDHLNTFASNVSDEELSVEYKARLLEAINMKEEFQNAFKQNKLFALLIKEMQIKNTQHLIKQLDDWALDAGKWFTSGELGSGMVSYNDHFFIAEKQDSLEDAD